MKTQYASIALTIAILLLVGTASPSIFPDARIGRVVITAGDYAGPDDSPTRDVVMMDDFIYAEPRVR